MKVLKKILKIFNKSNLSDRNNVTNYQQYGASNNNSIISPHNYNYQQSTSNEIFNDSDVNTNNKNCSRCDKPFTERLWCKECDPFKIVEGWTSGNPDIDKFIKDTMYKPKINP